MQNIISSGILCILMSTICQAQTLSNQGALISVKSNAFVSVQGDVVNDNGGTFDNSNEIYCFGDWEHHANNTAFVSRGEGVVYMTGDNQTIKGTSITQFYDLRLEGTGTKFATIDVHVDGFLRLSDREMNVDTNTVEVFNTNVTAVSHTQNASTTNWGMVSALDNGGLQRHTANAATYFYPVGSNVGTARFRPVEITPDNNSPNAYKVRLANDDPTSEGWDRNLKSFEICTVNPLYYHRISHPQGNTAAQVGIYYDANQDGSFNSLGKWQLTNIWAKASIINTSTSATYGLSIAESNALTDFNPNPFALTETAPETELTASPNPICSNETVTLTASNAGTAYDNYDFYIDSFLVQSSSSDTYMGSNFRAGDVPVWVVGSYTDCGSQSDTTLLEVWQGVEARAFSDTIIVAGTAANLSATGGDFYNWLPDTALSCAFCNTTLATPNQTTRYTVEVESLDGCMDTVSVLVEVKEDIQQVLFIPNVLTPNGDGFNDSWEIKNIQLFPKNSVKIVNRWGDVVYSAAKYQNDWEGNFSGAPLPAGTYYYVLDIGGSWGIVKGDVTILRE